jgi:hypothetical protein
MIHSSWTSSFLSKVTVLTPLWASLSYCSLCHKAEVLTGRLEFTAISLRVFNVASDSMYKYKVFAGDVNVARPKPIGIDQDYFVAPSQEWVYGTRFADDPRTVRQFQVLQGNSGCVSVPFGFYIASHPQLTMFSRLSLASALSKDDSIKFIEIQISPCK